MYPLHPSPPYLQAPADNSRRATLEWFRNARYGLFLHYGLYSLLGRHEWVQFHEKIPVAEYAKLAEQFTAENFDAKKIATFAVDAGMSYVNITTRHHDSFCLFRTEQTEFQSLNTPCGRDLVEELAEACRDRGLGLCLYYSHGRDWRHPHAPNNGEEWGDNARPRYDQPDPHYATGEDHDLEKYLEFMKAQIRELLTQYGPITAIWLDGIGTPLCGDYTKFRCQELYDIIHDLQPHVLVSYKEGLLGTEDFCAPEHSTTARRGKMASMEGVPREVCTTMAPGSWGYNEEKAGQHKDDNTVWEELRNAGRQKYNLLLNTGPLPDGALDPEDVPTLRNIGKRLREEGWPK